MKEFFKNLFKYRSVITYVSWIVVLVYAVASINLLVIAVNWIGDFPGAALNTSALVGFSLISFLLVVLVASYYLSSLVRRRKRRGDRQRLSRAKFIRAKHRFSPRALK